MKTMKLLIILFLTSCISFAQTQITVLHTGDSHSHLDAFGPKNSSFKGTIGGIGKAAYIINAAKTEDPDALLLHAGDFFTGDLFFNKYLGIPELQILKQLGCDALTIGNHEFDFGPDILLNTVQQAFSTGSFPLLSANLNFRNYPALDPYINPYIIKTVNGVDIGIFGMTIPTPLNFPSPVIVETNIAEITASTVAAMKTAGADVIIFLSHLGYGGDSSLAASIPGMNFIIGGHNHQTFSQPKTVINPLGKPTYIMQSGSYYEYVGKLKFNVTDSDVNFESYQLISADSTVPQLPSVQSFVETLKDGIIAQFGDVYNTMHYHAKTDINKYPSNPDYKDTPMGNLVTDAFRQKTSSDVALNVNGLITDKIYRGVLNKADIFRTASYGYNPETLLGFNLVNVNLNGFFLILGLEVALAGSDVADYAPEVSGMVFEYNPENPAGSRIIRSSVRINGQPINLSQVYTVTVNEGLFKILTGLGIQHQGYTITGYSEYKTILEYIGILNRLEYKSDGRIKTNTSLREFVYDKELPGLNKKYVLYDNYPNPFNPATNIKFTIPNEEFVTLKIYNSLGQEVKNIVSNSLKAGTHTFNFNAANLSSGIYYYVLKTGAFTETKRMTLIK